MERAYSDAASLEEEGQRPDLLEPDYRAVCLTPQFAITIIPATYVLGSNKELFYSRRFVRLNSQDATANAVLRHNNSAMTESTILIVEDEANIRSLIAQQLKWDGYVVIEADNGLDGLILAEEQSPDLIILDMLMPGMNGLEFLSRMGQRSGDPVPVIVMSGSLNQQVAKECVAAGVTEMLCKPFRLEALKSAVKRATDPNSQAA